MHRYAGLMRPELSALIAACHSKVCAPPPIGDGGSEDVPGSTMSETTKKRLAALDRRGDAVRALKNTAYRTGASKAKLEKEYRAGANAVKKGILSDIEDGDYYRPERHRQARNRSIANNKLYWRDVRKTEKFKKALDKMYAKRDKTKAAREAKYGKGTNGSYRGIQHTPRSRVGDAQGTLRENATTEAINRAESRMTSVRRRREALQQLQQERASSPRSGGARRKQKLTNARRKVTRMRNIRAQAVAATATAPTKAS